MFAKDEEPLMSDNDRMIRLETDMAYLQDMVRELNDIVAQQQAMLTKLEKQNEALNKRIEDMDTEARPNRRPPHYCFARGAVRPLCSFQFPLFLLH